MAATKSKAKTSTRKSGSTKSTSTSTRKKQVLKSQESTRPVKLPVPFVDFNTQSADGDPHQGHFVNVTGGENQGIYGVFEEILTYDKEGFPKTVSVRSRDDKSDLYEVKFSDLEAAQAGRR